MSINVNRNLSDQFYRYKMPKLIAKVEGKGNGIKTVIVNMVEIAKSLNRPPMYPTKFFGCILGAQTNFDKNERYIVNGSHEANKLQDILDSFIQKYVLCPSCSNPETDLHVSAKRQVISTSCKACGYTGVLPGNDKLVSYIIKYPPETNSSKAAKDKKAKRKEKEAEKAREKEVEELTSQDKFADNGHKDDDDDWCEDTDADAVAKRMSELTAGAKGLMLSDDLEKSSEERLQIFFEYMKRKIVASGGVFDVNAQKDIVGEAERLDVKDKSILVLCELLLNENIMQQIKNHRLLFLRFTAGNTKCQKYMLRAIELTIKLYKSQLLTRIPHIFKTLYDEDILDEKVILEWAEKPNKKTVGKELAEEMHKMAAPFIKWLKEAEEEDESDEDDDDEQLDDEEDEKEVVFTTQSDLNPKKPSEDDIDIDAI